MFRSKDEIPALSVSRPQTGLSFLGPEPEDLEDLYSRYKKLQQELEFLEVQEEYIKDEQKNLKKEFLHAQEEVKRIQSIPLVIGQFLEAVDQNTAIVGSTTGSNYYVRILSTIDRELLKPNASVALHKHSNALVDVLPPEADSSIMMLTSDQKPDVMYADIGGMDIQKQEVREAVELPLTHFELYKQIGIDPPRGVLMYGPPGCGKTMLAKAVAHHTTAAFIRVVGSEFVQKYLGEGPRMVRDVFRLAKENAPAIIFIDEIDAIATKRFDAQTGADREVQRILLELLNQMDGFDQNVNVKVIMATNRADTLDPALLRPGRLDRKIEFPLPDRRQKRLIFSTITSKMNLSEEVDLEDCILLQKSGRGPSWERGLDLQLHFCHHHSPDCAGNSFLNSLQMWPGQIRFQELISIPSVRRVECWLSVKTATLSWPRTSRKHTRLSSRRTSRSMSFTSDPSLPSTTPLRGWGFSRSPSTSVPKPHSLFSLPRIGFFNK
ncbi:26S proteasome regulatory subunit 6B isoform X2 [Pongo abelii]|uniref:26S proteasome regulatory subunit 6B isoform X2 n=1 Tax=Pongo abelii TaxID=9601 RepID=UPI0023E2C17A|nr:26S proteasome regulatory subunit 6B isoform X2 [Pongo pygmaeus]XP_054394885.1 26S proteasome regulatory subunit 6B isoform X2 [Pongo abelii]